MIVKDEIKVLKRCLDSVKDEIDYWVICDTGSTDGTQEFIRNYFNNLNIEGELHQDEWKDFGYNRTQVFKRAEKSNHKFDYYFV